MSISRLKQLRLEKGMTLTDLALKTGISESHLSRVEAGARGMRLSKLRMVAKYLGVDPQELIGEEVPSGLPDLVLFTPPSTWRMALDFDPSAQKMYKVLTNVLNEIGITTGDPLIADTSKVSLGNLRETQPVVASIRPSDQEPEVLVLRQFIKPRLLITNSSSENSIPIQIVNNRVKIIGLVLT